MDKGISRWWAYRHINGEIHVKRYTADTGPLMLDDAYMSDFVDEILDAYYADGRLDAERIAKERLAKHD